ncbi:MULTISPECIES: ATP-binding protein [unclassified Frankia]|uniref:ATP-binding protein n=1 Tax=unclassified Frankia TaxID=2632575 RepID=UPI001EF6D921|nr:MULTISPECIES: ATP-binding protein [unclassified Frankia]
MGRGEAAVELDAIVRRLRSAGGELEDVEVKRAAGGLPRSVAETMSAFANSRGGLLILGLDECAGFSPVDLGDPTALRDEVVAVARGKITPPLAPSVELVPFEGAVLVVTDIDPLPPAQRPCYVTARGLYNGAFTRIGDGDQRLTPYEIDRLRENPGQPRWDEEPVPEATVDDLDRGAVLRLVEVASRNSPRAFAGLSEPDALVSLGVLVAHNGLLVPSLAGLLSVGRYPQRFFPQLMVSVAVYPHEDGSRPGPGGVRFLDSAAVGGNAPTMVADAMLAVQRNLRRASRIVGAGREDIWEIAPEVIREVVVNALMHRDYSPQARGTQVQVELFPDRFTVTSPGGLFGNVRLETLGEASTSSSRNARLAALLQETGDPLTGRPVAENRGSGVGAMISQVRRDTGLVPLFSDSLDYFRVTIPRTSPVTPELRAWAARLGRGEKLSEAQLGALALAKAGYDIDVALLRRLALSTADARRELGHLRDLGILVPRRAREDGAFRLASGLLGTVASQAATTRLGRPGTGLADRILVALAGTDSASREELQAMAGASRSAVAKTLGALLSGGQVEATAPLHSPYRRYRLAQP